MDEYQILDVLSSNTRSGSAINFLLEKYHDCRANHAQCNTPKRSGSVKYPSRLLDVGTEEHDPVILRSTGMFRDEEYVCLSHCWGDTKPFTLTSRTQPAFVRGINVTALPKTFQDAIFITRRLHIKYLWVDSLYATPTLCWILQAYYHRCILQDNEADWAVESGRMEHVYAHAACTIAATASKNSDGGLFFGRNPSLLKPRFVDVEFGPTAPWIEDKVDGFRLGGSYWCDVKNLAYHCIENAPLNSRAWVSQERQLSRRIMHFSRTQLFWECYECTACEMHPKRLPDWAMPSWWDDPTAMKRQLHDFMQQDKNDLDTKLISPNSRPGLDDKLYFAWGSFRIMYSQCGLTKDNDKLVALRGIAQQISQETGDELIAGLWQSRMIEELCWFKHLFWDEVPPEEPTQWRAPTWSWASSNAQIWVSFMTKFHGQHASRCFEAELVDIDVRSKVSGELKHASLRLKCKLLAAIITPAPESQSIFIDYQWSLKLIDHDGDPIKPRSSSEAMFSMDDFNKREPKHVYIVVAQRCLHSDDVEIEDREHYERSSLEGLLLRSSNENEEQFERIGFLYLATFKATRQILEAHRKEEDRIITLI